MVDFQQFPEAEHARIHAVNRALSTMGHLIDEFSAALELFDRSHTYSRQDPELRLKIKWQFLAASQGALIINSFGRVASALNSQIARTGLAKLVARDLQKAANKLLDSAFASRHDVRLGAAHPGELSATPESIEEHRISGMYVENNLFDRHFGGTVNGKWVTYELSQASADTLENIYALWARSLWSVHSFREDEQPPALRLFNEFLCNSDQVKLALHHVALA